MCWLFLHPTDGATRDEFRRDESMGFVRFAELDVVSPFQHAFDELLVIPLNVRDTGIAPFEIEIAIRADQGDITRY